MSIATEALYLPRALKPRVRRHRTADLMIEALVRADIDTVFGIPGGTIATLHDALLDRPEIRVITTRHEGAAMFAAAGYARATGKPGIVIVTSGPGALNCMTGLASAYCDGTPVIVLAGEVPRRLHGRRALQEGSAHHLNIVGVASPITKMALEVTDPNAAQATLKRALSTACSGRPGPVLLTLPLDVTMAEVRRAGIAGEVTVDYRTDRSLLANVARTLTESRRPAILAGSGVRWGRGPERLQELAERLQAPVMTTPKAKGVFPESHPLALGVFGHGGHPSTREYLEKGVDVLLAVATGLSDPATDGWSDLLKPSDHLIQIDAEALQMGHVYPVSVGIVGRADEVMAGISAELRPQTRGLRCFGVKRFADPKAVPVGEEGRISPPRALWELQQVMPRDTLYTCDIGQHLIFATHYLHIDDPDGFTIMTGLASMGSGIATSLGIKLGRPERPVVSICGDGCLAMSMGELSTFARERVPVLLAVLNDRRYGMVELGHESVYGRRPSYPTDEIQIDRVVRSCGIDAVVVEGPGQILNLDLPGRLAKGPLVLDIRIDRTVRMPSSKRDEQLKQAHFSD